MEWVGHAARVCMFINMLTTTTEDKDEEDDEDEDSAQFVWIKW